MRGVVICVVSTVPSDRVVSVAPYNIENDGVEGRLVLWSGKEDVTYVRHSVQIWCW